MRKNTIKNGIFRTDLATQSYLQRLIKHVDSPHLNDDKLEPLTHWKIILDTINNLYVGGSSIIDHGQKNKTKEFIYMYYYHDHTLC